MVATKLPADLAWQPIASPPFQRQYAAATGGGQQALGRSAGSGASRPARRRRCTTPPPGPGRRAQGCPLPLHHHAAVTYKGEAVVIGGFVPGAELTSGQSDRVFALRDGAWVPLPKLNHARAAAGAAVVGDKIVVVGGQADGKLVPQTEVFDGERWTDVAELPTPREHLGAASDGRYLYAVGGRALSADQNTGTLERYDPESDTWTKLDSMPEAAGSVGVTYAAGRVFAIGGESTTSVSDAVQAYDIPKGRWSQLPSLPTARHGVAATAVDGSVYAIGGATEPGHVGSTKEADVLDLSGGPAQTTAGLSWRTVADAPDPTQYAGVDRGRRARLAPGRDRSVGAGDHRYGGLRPRDQHLDRGPEAAAGAASRGGRDLPGRPGRDRRLRAGGRADLEAVRSRLRPARRRMGAAASAQPRPRRGSRGGGRQQDRRGRRPGGRQAGARDRGLRRPALDDRRGHPDAARAPRRGLGRPLPVRRRRPQPLGRQEQRRRWNATTPPATAGRS